MKYSLPIMFALGTAICWGMYGPVLGFSRSPGNKLWTPFKPYVGIGLAYIVWAFVGGLIAMYLKKDSFSFSGEQSPALLWGFAAGSLGAIGALCLTNAMLSFEGPPKAQLVMPIVFGGAVSVMALIETFRHRNEAMPGIGMWVGLAFVICGIALVAKNTPHGGGHKKEGKPVATAPNDDHSETNQQEKATGK